MISTSGGRAEGFRRRPGQRMQASSNYGDSLLSADYWLGVPGEARTHGFCDSVRLCALESPQPWGAGRGEEGGQVVA
jgi:hypothetical protein